MFDVKTSFKSSVTYFSKRAAVLLPILFIFLYGAGYGLSWYANSLSDPVNEDANYPDEAFQTLYDDIDGKESDLMKKNMENLRGSNFQKRIEVSGNGLLDVAITGGQVIDSLQKSNSTRNIYTGNKKVTMCGNNTIDSSYVKCRSNTTYPAAFSAIYKGWMDLALNNGNVRNINRNETTRKVFTDYIERARFYDSYLNTDFKMRPIESVHYSSDSGLYLIGEGTEPIYVDGDKVSVDDFNGSGDGEIIHIDIELDPGYHTIRKNNFSLRVPVHGYKPNVGVNDEGQLYFDLEENESSYFRRAIVQGSNFSKEIKLNNRDNIEVNLSAKPRKVSFIRENFTITESVNVTDREDSRPLKGEGLGMTKEEWRSFKQVSDRLEITYLLPGISKPQNPQYLS